MSREFKYHELILTKNDCYKAGRKIKPKGIMWHSTGANNPKLSRYVGPDDGILGKNPYNNHWNQPRPDGRQVCVHAFIGKDKNDKVRTYQTLPWDHRGWHAGGKANDTHIGFEICEDSLKDRKYFNAVYNEAINLTVYLCRKFNLTEKDVIDHAEGHRRGIASNHGDVGHWFTRFGKTMDDVRKDVGRKLREVDTVAELLDWQRKQGEKALDSLNKKKDSFGNPVVNDLSWKEKLGESVPGWLFWSIVDRIT